MEIIKTLIEAIWGFISIPIVGAALIVGVIALIVKTIAKR